MVSRGRTRERQTRLSHLPLEFHREAPGTVHACWMVSALARDAVERDRSRQHLAAAGVETRPVFHPVHTLGPHPNRIEGKTVADDITARGLNLPSWPDIDDEAFELECRAEEEFYGHV
ncbi:MAG: DegT/DnrJ/EryC1/StrS family aminotransferase [Hyphomicrobium sp.]|nr:DegT/DnrJ/EryC1/StrS family aminotransferase [Hyphomicrobium sp.]